MECSNKDTYLVDFEDFFSVKKMTLNSIFLVAYSIHLHEGKTFPPHGLKWSIWKRRISEGPMHEPGMIESQ